MTQPATVSTGGINLVKRFEGLHKVGQDGTIRAYRCPAGRWTIGYGHTKGVRSGVKGDEAQCEQWLQEDLDLAGQVIKRYVHVPLSQAQFDALASFVFNVGEANFSSSTLLKKLNKGLYDEVPAQIIRWNKARVDGELTVLRGLTRRRTAEAALFAMDATLASDGGEAMVQKPEQTATKPLTKSKTLAGAYLASFGIILQEVASVVQLGDIVQYGSLTGSLVGVGLVAYARIKDHNEGER